MLLENKHLTTSTYLFDGFELVVSDRILKRKGEKIALTPRAFDLLVALVRARGHLLSKTELMSVVWSDAAVEEGNLNRTISSLRKALGEHRGENRYIETVPKAGYRFIAPIHVIGDGPNHDLRAGLAGRSPNDRTAAIKWRLGLTVFILIFGGLVLSVLFLQNGNTSRKQESEMLSFVRLTNSQFDDDQAEWTFDGKIRFTRYVTSTRAESWIMDADGSDQRRANDKIPSLRSGQWSPDGKQVVFGKDGESAKNVYLANSDGTGERKLNLTHPPSAWSADGTRFVFAEMVDKTNSEIFVYEIATGVSVNISNNTAFDADPLFSPDGKTISFVSSRDGNNEAYLMNLDGSDVRRLTNDQGIDAFPSVSPDGTQVVFDSNREGENIDLYEKDIDNDLPPRKLTALPSNEEHRGNPWSPDGSKMLITSDHAGKSNIYVISAESTTPRLVLADPKGDLLTPFFAPNDPRLIFQARYEDKSIAIERFSTADGSRKVIYATEGDTVNLSLSPDISPDGRSIVFANRISGNTDLFIVGAEGGEPVDVSNSPTAEGSPSFSADGKRIYFQSNRDAQFGRFHIFSMNLDGSDPRRLTVRDGYEFSPVEARPGWVIFSCDREDAIAKALDICTYYPEKPSSEERIVSRHFHDTQPAYSPNLDLIAFVSQSEGNSEIFIVRPNGRGMVRITNDPADDTSPRFYGDSLFFSSDRNGKFAIYQIDLKRYSPESLR